MNTYKKLIQESEANAVKRVGGTYGTFVDYQPILLTTKRPKKKKIDKELQAIREHRTWHDSEQGKSVTCWKCAEHVRYLLDNPNDWLTPPRCRRCDHTETSHLGSELRPCTVAECPCRHYSNLLQELRRATRP